MSHFSIDWSELSLQVMITFAHFLWQACVVAILLAIGDQAFEIVSSRARALRSFGATPDGSRFSANFRYTAACIAFFSLPICVISTYAWVHQARGPIFLAAVDGVEPPLTPISPAIGVLPAANPSRPLMAQPGMPANPIVAVLEPTESSVPAATGDSPTQRLQAFAPYILMVYMVGVALMLARFCLSVISSSRLRRTIELITDVKLLQTIEAQCKHLGLNRQPLVAICQRVSVPVVVGIVKPMILLPPALLCGLDPNQVSAILCHELAHIRRYDLIVNLLQRILEALLFFHPVTWWISRRVSIERENCCDEVAAGCVGRLPYAGALLQMAELCIGNDRRRSTSLATLATLAATGGNSSDLGYRVRRLIGANETTRVKMTRRSIAIAVTSISLLTASLVAWGQNRTTSQNNTENAEMPKIFTPEPLWQTKVAVNEVASEMSRISPVVVAANRMMSIEKDFDMRTGQPLAEPFPRLPRTYEFEVTLDPILRRKSSDRRFIVEVSVRMPGNTWSFPSYDVRVLRASDGSQVGVTITPEGIFESYSCDVDVENGGDFLVLGIGNEVRVYRTATGQVEAAMPIKTKRVDAIAISPDRKWIVVSELNDLHFWRWRDHFPVETIHAGRRIDSLVFTPDGQYLAEGPDSQTDIEIRDMRTREVIASLKDEVGSPLMVTSMDITADGRFLVAHNEVSVDQSKLTIPHRIHVWDLKTRGRPVFQIATGEWVRSVAFSDDGQMIAGEFTGAAHGALLAAWQLPNELIQQQIDASKDANVPPDDGVPITIVGESATKKAELHESDIYWGMPIAGMQVGARIVGDAKTITFGKTVEADLFVANVSDQPIECSIAVPHVSLGWLIHVQNSSGDHIKLKEPIAQLHSPYVEDRVIPFKLAPGEVAPITVEGKPLQSRATFVATSTDQTEAIQWKELPSEPLLATTRDSQSWYQAGLHSFRLITTGGEYSAIFQVTAFLPGSPAAQIDLSSENVPFTVLNQNQTNDGPTDILWGEQVGGMRLGIRQSDFARQRSPLRHGEHIDYEVWIKNETDEIVQIARDPRDVYNPRLMDDRSINVIGGGMFMSFGLPQGELEKAELILLPGQAAQRFTQFNHSASIRPPGSPRGRFGSDPLHLEPGKYSVYAQLGELKSGVEEVEIIPASRLQMRKTSRVTEKKREYAADDPSEAILAWQSGDGEKHEAMVNWDHGVLVDERDLASVEILPVDGKPDQYSVLLQLRPESATWLESRIKMYSLWDDPDLVAILLDDKPLATHRLDSSIRDGNVLIDNRFSKQEADDVASKLRSIITSNWITAPQLCVGKAYSATAKAANWKWDQEQRASLATPENGEMLASCLPGAAADFVVTVSLKFTDDAECRLTVGETTFDFSQSAQLTKLRIGEKEHAFRNDSNASEWTLIQVQRRNNSLTVQVHEQPRVDLGTSTNAVPKISLQSKRGTIAVKNFVVTGNVEKISPP